MKRIILLLLIFITYFTIPLSAKVITIPTDNYPTIQTGIDSSSDGDTVQVFPGTYVENINFNGHNVVLVSLFFTTSNITFITSTIINADSSGTAVVFENGEDSAACIIGFTIQNGRANNGGGIYCKNSSPTISNNRIIKNTADEKGGGIRCLDNSNPIIIDNTISQNIAGFGGGIHCHESNPTISNNDISNNSTGFYGGGIYCSYSNPIISGNTISDNSTQRGGGIYINHSDAVISKNIINNNSAEINGGGIHCSYSNPVIINNVIFGNTSYHGGGIYCIWRSDAKIINNTITGNSANLGGGISFMQHCKPTVLNNILWPDTAFKESSEIYIDKYSSPEITYCNINGGWSGEGNIDVPPLFRNPDNADFHLMAVKCGNLHDSPCIDAGNPDSIDAVLDCFHGLGTKRSDMGAYGGGHVD